MIYWKGTAGVSITGFGPCLHRRLIICGPKGFSLKPADSLREMAADKYGMK